MNPPTTAPLRRERPRLALGAGIAALAVAAVAATSSPSARSPDAPRLRIATEGALAPWNFTDPAGQLAGFEVELAGELCRRMQVECEVVAQDWDGMIPALQQGRYDAVMAGMSITDERARVVDFAGPYAADPAVFAVRPGSALADAFPGLERVDLSTPAGLDAAAGIARALVGHTVAVQASTTHARMMESLFPGAAVRVYDRLDQAVLDLMAGRVDAVLGPRTTVDAAAMAEGGRIVTAGPAFVRGPLGLGVGAATRKGDELANRLTAAIEAVRRDGTTARLSTRWFGFDVTMMP